MSSQEELQKSLKEAISREVRAHRKDALRTDRAFEVVSDIYYELMGDLFLADHYGGEEHVPVRAEIGPWLETRVRHKPRDDLSQRGTLGQARAEALSPERRSEIASGAARARWVKS